MRYAWVTIAVVLALQTAMAVDVNINFKKEFDFTAVRSWAWAPDGAGEVKMARTQEDDPDAARKVAEPLIMGAVATEMERRGLQLATGAPDVHVRYFLLLTTTVSAQTLGQFLPSTTAWGLPPFAAATQSMTVMNRGALVLDVSANQAVVWRGVADAKIEMGAEMKRREALIREAVRDLLRRFPPRS
jgi:hypothetical protein